MGRVKIVACDPGESFGHCVGEDNVLQYAGTVDMWEFVHTLGAVLLKERLDGQPVDKRDHDPELLERLGGAGGAAPPEQVVVEDWALYPWVLKQGGLDFDKCRTARAIGAIEYICRASGTPYTLQPASIKDTAQAAGVEELYLSPRHENRHANDAMQHFVYFNLRRGQPPVQWAQEGAAV